MKAAYFNHPTAHFNIITVSDMLEMNKTLPLAQLKTYHDRLRTAFSIWGK